MLHKRTNLYAYISFSAKKKHIPLPSPVSAGRFRRPVYMVSAGLKIQVSSRLGICTKKREGLHGSSSMKALSL